MAASLDGTRDQQGSDGSAHLGPGRRQAAPGHNYNGLDDAVVDMHAFGSSAPLQDVKNRFGFTRRPSLASPSSTWPSRTAAPAGVVASTYPAGAAGAVHSGKLVKRVRAEW